MSNDAKFSALYQRASPDGPSAELDAHILAAARARKPKRNWFVPLSTAAMVVFGASVAMLTLREHQAQQMDMEIDAMPSVLQEQAPGPQMAAPDSADDLNTETQPAAVGRAKAPAPAAKPSRAFSSAPAANTAREKANAELLEHRRQQPIKRIRSETKPTIAPTAPQASGQSDPTPASEAMLSDSITAQPTKMADWTHIRRLLNDGDRKAAIALLTKWQAENPGLEIPDDIRQQLEKAITEP